MSKLVEHLHRRLAIKRAFRKVFETEEGRLVLFHLAREAGITRPTLTSDTNSILVREGRQQIVYSIMREAQVDEATLLKQIEQANQQPERYDP
jgi:hypothetical protein